VEFEGKRRSGRALGYGVLWLIAMGGVMAAVVEARGAAGAGWAVYIGLAGAGGLVVSAVVAMIPRAATLALEGGAVRPSWRPGFTIDQQPTAGRLVLAGVDAPVGVVIHLDGGGAHLSVGCAGHPGTGFAITRDPVRAADFELGRADFARFIEQVQPAPATPGRIAIGLVLSSQSAGGVLRMMAPWLITMVVASAFGLVVGATGLAEQAMASKNGVFLIGGATMAIVLTGLAFTILRAQRVRKPGLELHLDQAGIAVVRLGKGAPVEVARAPWTGITAAAQRHRISGKGFSMILPVLALRIGELDLAAGAWDGQLAWPGEVAKARRSPRWLIGAPEWPLLVAALRQHGRLAA
jgi:hypothetical protein